MTANTYLSGIPAVFVSSTCYDLKQIRADLKDFIENQLGFNAVLSEFDSFPVDSSIKPIDNCIRAVRECADIFVLIVGGRYGNPTDSGKSVTNLEYINARAKGIPIYVFVNKGILNVLPIWKLNQDANFSNIVDSNKLFEFVENLRNQENIWMFEFEIAQDIVRTLKRQISYLVSDLLDIRKKFQSQQLSPKMLQLNPEALRIALEKPLGWEYLLLGEAMKDNVSQLYDAKRDLMYGISFGKFLRLEDPQEILNWIIAKNDQLILIIKSLATIFNKAVTAAIGKPGEPGDVEEIIYVAQRFGNAYGEIIKCGLEYKSLSISEDWQRLINFVSTTWESPIKDMDEYLDKYNKAMNKIKTIPVGSEENITLDLTFELTAPDVTSYYTELDILRNKYGMDQSLELDAL